MREEVVEEVDPAPRTSSSQRSRSTAQQVYPTLARLSSVTNRQTCLALNQKSGFLFLKEELSYSPTCQLSSLPKEYQNLRIENSFQNSCSLEMSGEKFPTAGQSSSKRLRQPVSKGMASHTNWAWRPTANGQGVPQKKGMMSLHPSSNLEKKWSEPFSLTGVTSNWQVRPRRPQIGSLREQNGNSSHGMNPSWVTCKLLDNLQDKVPDNGHSGPFFKRLQSRMPWWQRHSAYPGVLTLITHSVTSSYPLPSSL